MESSPWNGHGFQIGLGEFFDKVLFHMESMEQSIWIPWTVPYHSIPFQMDSIVIVLILVILIEFEN